jgi:hypothetical protein
MWHCLRPVLAASDDGPGLLVPARHRRRLHEQTVRLRQRLGRGNYAVHGDLPDPAGGPGVTAPDEERVLAVAMRLLLEAPLAGLETEPAGDRDLADRSVEAIRSTTATTETTTETREHT